MNRTKRDLPGVHILSGMVLSFFFTGAGMLYTGIQSYTVIGIVFMVAQGFLVYISIITMGFMFIFAGPIMFVLHLIAIYLTYKSLVELDRLSAEEREKMLRLQPLLLRVFGSIACFALLIWICYSLGAAPFRASHKEYAMAKSEATRYLEQKYGEKFIITDTDYTFAIDSFNMTANPVQQPKLSFYLSGKEEFSDNYPFVSLSNELEQQLLPMLKQHFGENGYLRATVNAEGEQPIIHYSELQSGEIIDQDIQLAIFSDLDKSNVDAEKERLREFVLDIQPLILGTRASLGADYYPLEAHTEEVRREINADFTSNDWNKGFLSLHCYIKDLYKVDRTTVLSIVNH